MKKMKKLQKRISEKRMKNLLKRLHGIEEKESFLSFFQREDKKYQLKKDLDDKEIKQLKALLKTIKKNSSSINKVRIIIVVFFVSAFVVFNLFFKNFLAERAIETGLQSLFKAKVECDGTRVSLIPLEIRFRRLAVADVQSPMKNLFELGSTKIEIAIWPLFTRKIIINDVHCLNIRWNTERKTSGALPQNKNKPDTQKANPFSIGEVGSQVLLAFDPKEFLDTHIGEMGSLSFAETLPSKYKDLGKEWELRYQGHQKEMEQIIGESQDILNTDIGSISDPAQVVEVTKSLVQLKDESEAFVSVMESDYRKLEADIASLAADVESAQRFLEEDIARLKELIPSLDSTEWLTPVVESLLREFLGKWYGYYLRGKELQEELTREKEARETKRGVSARNSRKGRTIRFPVKNLPSFWLKHFQVSFGEKESDPFVDFLITDISSEPDLVNRPISVSYNALTSGVDSNLDGLFDLRSDAEASVIRVHVEPIPFSISLKDIGSGNFPVDGYGGSLSFTFDGNYKDNITKGLLSITIEKPQVINGNGTGIVNEIMGDVLNDNPLEIKAGLHLEGEVLTGITVTTNLESVIASRMGVIQERLANEANALLEKEGRRLLDNALNELEIENDLLDMKPLMSQDISSIKDIEEKIEELQNEASGQLKNKIEEEANKAAEETRKRAEAEAKKAAESIKKSLPKLPF